MRILFRGRCFQLLSLLLLGFAPYTARGETVDADLLIVGGTESACAAAVQAARMGVRRIVMVNDIDWVGGQFTAEALMAIDENTDKTGIRHEPPIPRHGAFQEIIDRIEADNLKRYGVARPGNTRVITTCRPADAQRVFRSWLAPYIDSGQLQIHSWYEPIAVTRQDQLVRRVQFLRRSDAPSHSDTNAKTQQPPRTLIVNARMTIDASDWGDVIRLSGAEYEFGPDLKSKYNEPLAPATRDGHPVTDMNPITYCMVIVETDQYQPIPQPPGYDARNYRSHRYPKDPLWLYGTRRLVDHYHFPQIKHPDVLLLCFPAFDYPLDTWPQQVADALERAEPGSSKANLAELSPDLRRIVFADAKQYSLGFLHYLQTEVHDGMQDKTHSFRRFQLTDEFGTADRLPFKPYVRESLRLKAMYMMRQQDTTGVGGDSANFAKAMYHDAVASWQFEYDFHPTKREFLEHGNRSGPWRGVFRPGRTWGPPYSGPSVFPLRSLIPVKLDGLLGGQKNLGYSSIVSSAVRLHDQSMAVGQASGACAAYCILHDLQPREIPFHRKHLLTLQQYLVDPTTTPKATSIKSFVPTTIWPFRDLSPSHPHFAAINLLAVQRCLPLQADEVRFQPDQPATAAWSAAVVAQTKKQMASGWKPQIPDWRRQSRAEFAAAWWKLVSDGPWRDYPVVNPKDHDGDGIVDRHDALPVDPQNVSFALPPTPPDANGIPDPLSAKRTLVRQVNFGGPNVRVPGFDHDHGLPFELDRGFGWKRDLAAHHRQRGVAPLLADTYIFTRTHDIWECVVPNGKYHVEFCIGDSSYEQFGQNVTIEGIASIRNVTTAKGRFLERSAEVEVRDGRLTLEIGLPKSTTNTCLNWLRISKSNSPDSAK